MDVNYDVLKHLVDIAECGSFTRAAELGFTSQPVLSRKVAAFERSCGFRLFDRTSHPVKLTSEGEQVYACAVNALNGLKALDDCVSGLRSGRGMQFKVLHCMGGHHRPPPVPAPWCTPPSTRATRSSLSAPSANSILP